MIVTSEYDVAEEAAYSSVEEVQFVFPDCPPPNKFDSAEREAWDETVALIKHCRRTGIKVPIKIPSDLAVKWSKEQKAVWMLAKAGVTKEERRVEAA